MLCFPNFWFRGSKLTIFFNCQKKTGGLSTSAIKKAIYLCQVIKNAYFCALLNNRIY